ncbi:MAG: CD225/dispanin family protein [Butyricimonas paravirosa]
MEKRYDPMARGRRSTRTREMVHEHNLHAFQPPPFPPTPPQPPVNNNSKPDNWLVWAILSTILCCLPLGIVSIIYATKVDNLWNSGQQEEAIKASNMARLFFFLALGGGVLAVIIGFVGGLTSVLMGGGYY